MTNVGGFFATLNLKSDTASFEKGAKSLAEVGKGVKEFKLSFEDLGKSVLTVSARMAAAFLALGAAMGTLGVMTGKQMASLKTGAFNAGGMNPIAFQNLIRAADVSGGSGQGLAADLATLNETLQDLKSGDAQKLMGMAPEFAMATGNSHLLDIIKENPEKRIQDLMKALEGAKDQQAAMNMFRRMGLGGLVDSEIGANQTMGKSLSSVVDMMASRNLLTTSDVNLGAKTSAAANLVGADVDTTMQKIGSEINKSLEPFLETLDNWFKSHQKDLDNFAKSIGTIAQALFDFAGRIGKFFFGEEKGSTADRQSVSVSSFFSNPLSALQKMQEGADLDNQIWFRIHFPGDISDSVFNNISAFQIERLGLRAKNEKDFALSNSQIKSLLPADQYLEYMSTKASGSILGTPINGLGRSASDKSGATIVFNIAGIHHERTLSPEDASRILSDAASKSGLSDADKLQILGATQ